MSNDHRTTVEIWSDVACPWRFIGKRRFERVLETFEDRDVVDVVFRSFQLDPSIPSGTRRADGEYLSARMGRSRDAIREMDHHVVELAAAEGLAYDFDRDVAVNTFHAHRVAQLGRTLGKSAEINERLLQAQFEEGEVLDDEDTLVCSRARWGCLPTTFATSCGAKHSLPRSATTSGPGSAWA